MALNFNDTTPAAPAGTVNNKYQRTALSGGVRSVSVYTPAATATTPGAVPTPPNDATKFLSGLATWTTVAVTFAYDVVIYFPALQTSVSQEIFRMAMGHTTTFPGNFSGSQGSTKTSATGTTTFLVKKNGTQVGTFVYSASGTTPSSFTTTSGASVSFSAGDVLTVVGPATPDTTLTNWSVTLVGTRT